MKLGPSFSPLTKPISKWIKDQNIGLETLSLTEEKIENLPEPIGTGKDFLSRSPIVLTLRLTINEVLGSSKFLYSREHHLPSKEGMILTMKM